MPPNVLRVIPFRSWVLRVLIFYLTLPPSMGGVRLEGHLGKGALPIFMLLKPGSSCQRVLQVHWKDQSVSLQLHP